MEALTPKSIFREFNQSKLARELGVARASISAWRAKEKIPAERVTEVARLTGIERERLRPDMYS